MIWLTAILESSATIAAEYKNRYLKLAFNLIGFLNF